MRNRGFITGMNRRRFLAASVLASVAAPAWMAQGEQKTKRRLLLVGTQTHTDSKGIYAYNWDPASGELRGGELAAASDNPTFLALDPAANYLYAANELQQFEGQKSGAVSAFAVDRAAGSFVRSIRSPHWEPAPAMCQWTLSGEPRSAPITTVAAPARFFSILMARSAMRFLTSSTPVTALIPSARKLRTPIG